MFPRLLIILSFLALFSSSSHGQMQWHNYTDEYLIRDIDEYHGKIWIAHNGGITCFDKVTKSHVLYNRGNSNILTNRNQTLTADSIGRIWCSTSLGGLYGINMFDGNEWILITTNPSNGDTIRPVMEFEADRNGNIFFVNYTDIVKVDSNFNFSYLPPYPADTFQIVNSRRRIAIDTLGGLWITAHNLKYFDGNQWHVYDSLNSALPNGVSTDIIIDKRNNIYVKYISDFQAPAWYYRDSTGIWNELVLPLQGLAIRNADAHFVDHNNNIWFYSYNGPTQGVTKYDGVNFTNYAYPASGFPSNHSPSAFYVDESDHMFGSFYEDPSKIFHEFDGQAWQSYDLANCGLQSNDAHCIAIDHHDVKWIGFGSAAVASFDGLTWQWYDHTNSVFPATSTFVNDILVDNDNYIYACLNENGSNSPLVRFDGISWSYVTSFPNYNDAILTAHCDLSGKLWFGGWDGVYHFDGSSWQTFPFGAISEAVFDIANDSLNNIWISTFYDGVYKYDGQGFTHYDSTSGLLNSHCDYLVVDSTGTIYVSNQVGTFYFDGSDFVPAQNCSNLVPAPYRDYILGAGPGCLFFYAAFNNLIVLDSMGCKSFNPYNSSIVGSVIDLAYDGGGNLWLAGSHGIQFYNPNGITHETIYYPSNYPVNGKVFYDDNQNGLFDSIVDFGLSNKKILIAPDSTFTFTNITGKYLAYLDSGSYEIESAHDFTWQLTTDSAIFHLLIKDQALLNNDFGLWNPNISDEIAVNLTPLSSRCNWPSNHHIQIQNTGTTPLSGDIKYLPDDSLALNNYNPPPDYFSNDTAVWNYSGLFPNQTFNIQASFINPGIQPPGVLLESVLYVTYNGMPALNQVASQLITCSFDPNDKAATPAGVGTQHYIDGNLLLTYTIRFENTGNDTAFYVLITDKIDPGFDIQSFEPVASSHPVDIQLMPDRTVHFRFRDINLLWTSIDPVLSQGFVKYRINPLPVLPDYTIIENSANIYFDFNAPVQTNMVFHTIVDPVPVGLNEVSSTTLNVFPNPASDQLTFIGSDPMTVDFFDQLGKLTRQLKNVNPDESINISFLKNGFYILRITDGKGDCENFKLMVSREF